MFTVKNVYYIVYLIALCVLSSKLWNKVDATVSYIKSRNENLIDSTSW